MTFKQLQDRLILLANYNEFDRDPVKHTINLSLQNLMREHRWSWGEASGTVVLPANTSVVSNVVAGGVLGRIQNVVSPSGQDVPVPVQVDYQSEDPQFWWVQAPLLELPPGFPDMYVVYGGSFMFNRRPPVAVTYSYVKQAAHPAEITSDNTPIPVPDEAVEAVLYGALYLLKLKDRDSEMAAQYMSRYQSILHQLRAQDVGHRGGSKVALSARYGGDGIVVV